MTADTQPTLPLPDPDAGAQRPRRRRWPWVVLVIVVLAVAAAFAGEAIARSTVERIIREQAIAQLSLPADQQIDIDLTGPVLPQLIVGSIGHIEVSSADVPFQGLTGDVAVRADDVPVHGGGDWSGAYATITLDEAQLQALLASLDGFPAATVQIDAPDVSASFEVPLVVTNVPVGVALTPRAEGGQLVLTPSSLTVADAEISADAVLQQFGALASTVVRDWDVCIAQYLPRAVTLTGVEVAAGAISADFEIDSSILHEGAALEKGTCP